MTNLFRRSWVLAGAALMMGACGGSRIGGPNGTGGFGTGGFPDGYGGFPGTGGFPSTGGNYGLGGTYNGWAGYDGNSGTGGWTGTGGVPGTGGSQQLFPDGGACSSPSRGPLSTADASRPFGWTFTAAGALETGTVGSSGAAGESGAADAGRTGPARCQSIPAAYPGVSCVGTAYLKTTATGPAIVFADGSQLTWDGTLPAALMPSATNPIVVDYQRKTTVVCAVCGAYTTNTLTIRDDNGQIVFYDQQGEVLSNLTSALTSEIFGVEASQIQTCTYATFAGCYSYLRSEFDQQLATSPPQVIPDATLTTVTTPNGKFAVVWAASWESYVQRTDGCTDGPGVATDTGFVATRLSP